MAMSDMDLLSRVDAYFTNIKLPWEKKQSELSAIIGAVVGYKATKDPATSEWKFERLWVKVYGIQTNVLAWCESLNLLVIGMDDGKVYGAKMTSESGYTSHDDV